MWTSSETYARFLATGGLAICVAACGGAKEEQGASRGNPLINADEVPTTAENSAVVHFPTYFADDGQTVLCTATVVGPHHVLTAAHCLHNYRLALTESAEPAIYQDLFSPGRPIDLQNASRKLRATIAAVDISPSYRQPKPIGVERWAEVADVALIRVVESLAEFGVIPVAGQTVRGSVFYGSSTQATNPWQIGQVGTNGDRVTLFGYGAVSPVRSADSVPPADAAPLRSKTGLPAFRFDRYWIPELYMQSHAAELAAAGVPAGFPTYPEVWDRYTFVTDGYTDWFARATEGVNRSSASLALGDSGGPATMVVSDIATGQTFQAVAGVAMGFYFWSVEGPSGPTQLSSHMNLHTRLDDDTPDGIAPWLASLGANVLSSRVAVHRARGERHFYSTSESEIAAAGMTLEASGYFRLHSGLASASEPADLAPLYRCYAGGLHLLTRDAGCEVMGAAAQEGKIGYVASAPRPGTRALYRAFHPTSGDHLYTVDQAELDTAVSTLGYVDEGVTGYVW